MTDAERTLRSGVRTVLVETLRAGDHHDLMLFAAAMAYSLVLSFAPLTVAVSMLASRFDIAATTVLSGTPVADLNAEQLFGDLAWAGPAASVIAVLMLLWGASSLFTQLARALSRIWHQPGSAQGVWSFLRDHVFAFLLLGVAALTLLASAVVGNVVSGLTTAIVEMGEALGADLGWLATLTQSRLLIDFGFATVLFTVAFATVPRVRPRLRDILPGGLITGAAYALGQVALGAYLGSAARFSIPGVLGPLFGFLVWVYYTATIVLWGAELAYQIARYRACGRGGPDTAPYRCD